MAISSAQSRFRWPSASSVVPSASTLAPQANVALLGITSADQLAKVMAAAGLAQNLGALRALATVGIQAGHMKLHLRNMAASAGAATDEIEAVAAIVSESGERITMAADGISPQTGSRRVRPHSSA